MPLIATQCTSMASRIYFCCTWRHLTKQLSGTHIKLLIVHSTFGSLPQKCSNSFPVYLPQRCCVTAFQNKSSFSFTYWEVSLNLFTWSTFLACSHTFSGCFTTHSFLESMPLIKQSQTSAGSKCERTVPVLPDYDTSEHSFHGWD